MAAVPFGKSSDKIGNHEDLVDERLVRLARFCGYQIGFTTAHGAAKLGDDLLRLPRIEIQAGGSSTSLLGSWSSRGDEQHGTRYCRHPGLQCCRDNRRDDPQSVRAQTHARLEI